MAISNNIENIIGAKIPAYVKNQLETRVKKNIADTRSTEDLVYLANKTGWVRVVSSVDIKNDPADTTGLSDKAKDYVLFGGTSAYKSNSYNLRSGIASNGSYGILGTDEIQNYGYRPMPGIKSAKIASQGKLGSVRVATINFTVNNKQQLDIIDQLYFRPGYSILIEWGNTTYYKAEDGKLYKGEDVSIADPFSPNQNKDSLLIQINQNIEKSEGNYDAMIGIITNFSFSFNKDGSFDCTVVAMGLGILGDSVKLNNSNVFPGSYLEDIKSLAKGAATTTVATTTPTPGLSVAGTGAGGVSGGVITLDPNAAAAVSAPAVNALVDTTIKEQASKYSSFLELILRAMQVHFYNIVYKSITSTSATATKRDTTAIVRFDMLSDRNYNDFTRELFANGSLTNLINNPPTDPKSDFSEILNGESIYKKNYVYGFSKIYLESGTESRIELQKKLKPVELKDIMVLYIVQSQQNQNIINGEGGGLNYPSYIPLSLFLLIINHGALLYEPTTGNATDVPLFYIDFNPETNICLCNAQTISTNPYKFLIPFEGGLEDYKSIFREGDIVKEGNSYFFKDKAKTPVWDPSTDLISKKIKELNPFRDSTGRGNQATYRGKILNTLVNIDYLLQLIRSFSDKDEKNTVNLKGILEQLLSDMSVCLGAVNAFRLAYSDKGNCFYISDDQTIPPSSPSDFIHSDKSSQDVEIPLYGKQSIAEDVKLQTDMSTKLSSMIAISANSNAAYQATAGTDATSVGIYNLLYVDRYKPLITANKEVKPGNNIAENELTINSSVQFNSVIDSFYSRGNNSQDAAESVTNYYIERMTKLKASDKGTKASMLIPISINFTTDGISGFGMGQAFTISDEMLPISYRNRETGALKKVGFIITGTEQSIDANRWKSTIKGSMYYLKNYDDYTAKLGKFVGGTKAPTPIVGSGTNAFGERAIDYINNVKNYKNAAGASLGNIVDQKGFTQLTPDQQNLALDAMTANEGRLPTNLNYRNKNPMNIVLGAIGDNNAINSNLTKFKAFGVTKGDQANGLVYARFPDLAKGREAAKWLISSSAYGGRTLAQQLTKWLGAE